MIDMKARANDSIYWLDMNSSIHNFRANCIGFSSMTPNQQRELITTTPSLHWPFQLIVIDLTSDTLHTFFAQIDTSWLILYHLKPDHATFSDIISIFWELFHMYDVQDELKVWGRWNFKPCQLPHIVHCPNLRALPVMFKYHIPIHQILPVMIHMQLLDVPREAISHHHALSTHNVCHWEFLGLFPYNKLFPYNTAQP